MKPFVILTLSGLLSLASCEEKQPTPVIDHTIPAGPRRAAAAAANVSPGLKRDLAAVGLEFGAPVFLRALKRERVLELFVLNRSTEKYDLFRSYHIAGTSGDLGPKLAEGDGQVPEGFYFVPPAAMKPDSQYHLAFNIGFPNSYDAALDRTGSAIMIHGNSISIGCLAMTDEKIEEIYTLCSAAHQGGLPFFRVHIFPFRMTEEAMAASAASPHAEFWKNLKEGYDLFEKNHIPPDVTAADGKYRFE
ncbi:murein L,D-transpeptidase [Luteolibacter yonseiensis]|uniref:Murein L,D-transpeptidase n=1 Tax=Luteolibacter yonseiensis TaxID=1144680 RepID=A0A934R214_9BACT|nr:murein L,D-transpeptidase [Luteolibacter yonseiensis]MBK1814846.1 murein L,D-transpeptidase [Luteolibacter yonseiensis]